MSYGLVTVGFFTTEALSASLSYLACATGNTVVANRPVDNTDNNNFLFIVLKSPFLYVYEYYIFLYIYCQ